MKEKTRVGSFYKNLLLVSMDGSTLALQDTKENAATFGRSSNQNGDGAWPLARFVVLVECGTHLIFGANLGAYKDSEVTLVKPLVEKLGPGMLCLADRLFPSYELWKTFSATGTDLLWRVKSSTRFTKLNALSDGSFLAEWLPEEARRAGHKAVTVRLIEYRLTDAKIPSQLLETYRVITTLLDPVTHPAEELVRCYPERWEIELTIKESKTVLRKGRITLRSKKADLVKQEFWGMILAHYLVRKTMAQAAMGEGVDPDKLSYEGSIEIIKATQSGSVLSFSP